MSRTIRDLRPLAVGAAVAALALAAPVAMAAEEGARVARDAKTGELRLPNAKELRALQGPTTAPRGLLTGRLSPQPRVLRNGTKAVELTGEQMSYSVMTRQADGSLAMQCVDNAEEAQRLVEGGAVAASLKPKEHDHGTH